MDDPTRRGFLIIAGAGAAAAAGVTAIAAAGKQHDAEPAAEAAPVPTTGHLVAYVADAGAGRVSVMTGETEVVVHDPELVARLTRHASNGGRA